MKLLIGLILEYQEMLYRIAKSRLQSEDDVCDAVQDALISAYKSLNSLKEERYFKTWLIKILINKCNDFYTKSSRNKIVSFEDMNSYEEADNNDFTDNYGIDYLINSLSQDEQTILTLYYQEGYNEKEISKIMDINYATIRTKIRRVKEKIALKLGKEAI